MRDTGAYVSRNGATTSSAPELLTTCTARSNPTLDVVSSKGPVTQRHGVRQAAVGGRVGQCLRLQSADPWPGAAGAARAGVVDRRSPAALPPLPPARRTAATPSCTCTASASRAPTSSRPRPSSRAHTRPMFPTSREWAGACGRDTASTCRAWPARWSRTSTPWASRSRSSSATRWAARSSSSWRQLPRPDQGCGPGLARRRSQQPAARHAPSVRWLGRLREPPRCCPSPRDYLRFGALQSLSLFKAMTRYPTLTNLHLLDGRRW